MRAGEPVYLELFSDLEYEHEFRRVSKKPYEGCYVTGSNSYPIEINAYDIKGDHRHIIRDHKMVFEKTGKKRLIQPEDEPKEMVRQYLIKRYHRRILNLLVPENRE